MTFNYRTKDYSKSMWSIDDCSTEYDFNNNVIRCHCKSLGLKYYGIITDYSRIWDHPVAEEVKPTLWEQIMSYFNKEAAALIIFLLFLMILLPIIAIVKDKFDYAELKSD